MTTNGTHLNTWLTEPEAAARLGISERTLRRKTAAGAGPEKRDRQRPGLRPEPVYNPDDVDRLAAPVAHVMPAETVAVQAVPASTLHEVLNRIAGAVEYRLRDAQPRPPARWLTLTQASEATGLSRTLLRRLIGSGRLRVIRDRAIKVLQADLDSLDNPQQDLARLSVSRAKSGGAR